MKASQKRWDILRRWDKKIIEWNKYHGLKFGQVYPHAGGLGFGYVLGHGNVNSRKEIWNTAWNSNKSAKYGLAYTIKEAKSIVDKFLDSRLKFI